MPSIADWRRMRELVDRYRDLPLGGTDASIVAIAERLKAVRVATVDRHTSRWSVRPPSRRSNSSLRPSDNRKPPGDQIRRSYGQDERIPCQLLPQSLRWLGCEARFGGPLRLWAAANRPLTGTVADPCLVDASMSPVTTAASVEGARRLLRPLRLVGRAGRDRAHLAGILPCPRQGSNLRRTV
jgi:hypothetical protein